jgi:hypothetical protein
VVELRDADRDRDEGRLHVVLAHVQVSLVLWVVGVVGALVFAGRARRRGRPLASRATSGSTALVLGAGAALLIVALGTGGPNTFHLCMDHHQPPASVAPLESSSGAETSLFPLGFTCQFQDYQGGTVEVSARRDWIASSILVLLVVVSGAGAGLVLDRILVRQGPV